MSVNVNGISESQAYKIWYNYNFKGNSVGVSDSDYAALVKKWHSELNKWSNLANDENKYEISDEDFDDAKSTGKDNAKKETGYDGGHGNMLGRTIADGACAAVGAGVASPAIANAAKGAVGKIKGLFGGKSSSSTATKSAKGAGKAGVLVACALSVASAVLYMVKKPNKDQVEACETMKNEVLPEQQQILADTQDNLAETGELALSAAEEAEEVNEEANANIEEQKTEFDSMKETLYYIESDKASGMTLREDQKEWLKNNLPLMQEKGAEVAELQESATEDVEEKYEALGDLQENFDNAAESSANVEGVTEFAESFDRATKNNCTAEGIIQGIGGASAAINGAKAISIGTGLSIFGGIAYIAAGVAAVAAGVKDGFAAAEQFKWAGIAGDAIDARKNTQDMNEETQEIYEEGVDDYEGFMGVVEDLELDIPDDMEVTEEEAAMATAPSAQPPQNNPEQSTDEDVDKVNLKKKKSEKDSK